MKADLTRIRLEFEQLSSSDRAINEKRYLKSDLEFIGVPVPAIRKVATRIARQFGDGDRTEFVGEVRRLWKEPVHEFRSLAARLLEFRVDLLEAEDLGLVETMLREARSWVYVDLLAVHVVGALVVREPGLAGVLDRWSADDDFWIRRSAMLALLVPLREGEGDWARFARYADAMWQEKEFFIRKAIGWVLRDASKKNPGRVIHFLRPRAHLGSGVTIREAVKYLPEHDREEVLKAYRNREPLPR